VKRNLNKKNPWVVPFQMWIYWPSPLSMLPLHSNAVKEMMHLHLCWTTSLSGAYVIGLLLKTLLHVGGGW